ncbi:hypothetical protein AXG93_4324s1060 [Marchantia polymorpha subsp. ruderalis]|uniref:Uncharacterized protein n=1 Tax=Marchantia polymorpha subsp. ruderalis TaxID=1480154 RepID=A0A176VZU8_MARPO|nr:hypothetical protein AXG93_4324s1060 [Marchantia polymorpha subsp. ruderalis]
MKKQPVETKGKDLRVSTVDDAMLALPPGDENSHESRKIMGLSSSVNPPSHNYNVQSLGSGRIYFTMQFLVDASSEHFVTSYTDMCTSKSTMLFGSVHASIKQSQYAVALYHASQEAKEAEAANTQRTSNFSIGRDEFAATTTPVVVSLAELEGPKLGADIRTPLLLDIKFQSLLLSSSDDLSVSRLVKDLASPMQDPTQVKSTHATRTWTPGKREMACWAARSQQCSGWDGLSSGSSSSKRAANRGG